MATMIISGHADTGLLEIEDNSLHQLSQSGDLLNTAKNLTSSGYPNQALQIYQNISANELSVPEGEGYYLGKADAYLKLGMLVDAVRVLDQATSRYPDKSNLWVTKSAVMDKAGYSYVQLIPVLQKATTLDPLNATISSRLDELILSRNEMIERKRSEPKCSLCYGE